MITRTWAYGTRFSATVRKVDRTKTGYLVTLVEDEKGEAHILLGNSAGDSSAMQGDKGTITFTKGGPTGGYWQFKKDPTP